MRNMKGDERMKDKKSKIEALEERVIELEAMQERMANSLYSLVSGDGGHYSLLKSRIDNLSATVQVLIHEEYKRMGIENGPLHWTTSLNGLERSHRNEKASKDTRQNSVS